MKRCVALLLSALLLMTAIPMVSAESYNDDHFDWGEYACPHTHTEEVAEIPSTCIQQGRGGYIRCTDCKLILSGSKDPLPLGDHAYDSVVTTPNCENSGYTVHTCTVCGDSYADSRVEALGHDYVLTEQVSPTCVVAGTKVYVCATCGDSYTETLSATGRHTYDYECDEDCNVCGYIRDDAHNYIAHYYEEPTCGEEGYEIYKCWGLFCGTPYVYITIPATGNHKYSGDCDTVCNVCKQIRETAVSHTYILIEDVSVTCTTDGKQVYKCQGCGDSYTDTIAAVGHKYDIVITAPDCENGGYTTHTCTVCGDVRVDNRTEALGHAYDVEEVAATCTADGKKVYTCQNCGDSYTETLPATGHEYQSVVTAPDCVNDGYTTYTCAACGHTYVADTVPATGEHLYDDDTDAECNLCGHQRAVCKPGDANNDGKVDNKDLGLLQQYLNEWDVALDADAMDVNGDGKVNNKDLGLLQQHLNEWDVVLK